MRDRYVGYYLPDGEHKEWMVEAAPLELVASVAAGNSPNHVHIPAPDDPSDTWENMQERCRIELVARQLEGRT